MLAFFFYFFTGHHSSDHCDRCASRRDFLTYDHCHCHCSDVHRRLRCCCWTARSCWANRRHSDASSHCLYARVNGTANVTQISILIVIARATLIWTLLLIFCSFKIANQLKSVRRGFDKQKQKQSTHSLEALLSTFLTGLFESLLRDLSLRKTINKIHC